LPATVVRDRKNSMGLDRHVDSHRRQHKADVMRHLLLAPVIEMHGRCTLVRTARKFDIEYRGVLGLEGKQPARNAEAEPKVSVAPCDKDSFESFWPARVQNWSCLQQKLAIYEYMNTSGLTRRFWHVFSGEQNHKDRIPSFDCAQPTPLLPNFCPFLITDFFLEFAFRRKITRRSLLMVMVEFGLVFEY
jgi:hypothetical protein